MADEIDPITLKDLIRALAATVVATSQHLDQASVDLRNLYQSSGKAGLAALIPPRFTLDEVTMELAFVVTEAKPEVPGTPPEPDESFQDTPVNFTKDENDLVRSKILELDKEAIVAAIDARVADIRSRTGPVRKAIEDGRSRIAELLQQIADLEKDPNPGTGREISIRRTDIEGIGSRNSRLEQQIELDEGIAKKLETDKSVIASSERLTADVLQSLRPLNIPIVNRAGLWDPLLEEYRDLKSTFQKARDAFTEGRSLPSIRDFSLSDEERQVLELIPTLKAKRGEGEQLRAIRNKAVSLQADYLSTLTALNALVKQVAESKGSGLRVRVDAKALADAPPEARHKARLTFHSQSQQSVRVGDKDLEISE